MASHPILSSARTAIKGAPALLLAASALALTIAASGCNGPESGSESGAALGDYQGQDEVNDPSTPIPDGDNQDDADSTPPASGGPSLGSSCSSNDGNQICLGLKYVVYENSAGKPVVDEGEILDNLDTINRIWSKCDIAFQVDEHSFVRPGDKGLSYNTPTKTEISTIRRAYADSKTLLVVTTGTWSGSLGAGAANAWTMLPGGSVYGVVLEAPVATYPNIHAHELGHYLNLSHGGGTSNVMSPAVYSSSTGLTSSQCSSARAAVKYYFKAMMR